MNIDVEDFKVASNKRVYLKDWDSEEFSKWVKNQKKNGGKKGVKERGEAILEANRKKLVELQELFWASDSYSMLIILQGMDAAGKDSAIRHVMSGVNPQGCQVTSFKTPSEEELEHDFLWRYTKALPERGRIGIFNRSYYEDVLIVKVRPEVLKRQRLPAVLEGMAFWSQRYDDINLFERHLVRSGTLVLKFFLHLSKDQQKKRLLKRLENPDKQWKFSFTDLSERSKWEDYMKAYEEMLNQTSSEWAPWYIIPADEKLFAHLLISGILVSQIKKLNLKYPVLSKDQAEALETAKTNLQNE
jgi:PPK2 family polyphosphate:nucleotide phosphotransferase